MALVAFAFASCSTAGTSTSIGPGVGGADESGGTVGWDAVTTGAPGSSGGTGNVSGDATTASVDEDSGSETTAEPTGGTGDAACANWITPLALPPGGSEVREFELGPEDTLLGVAFTPDGALVFAVDRCDGSIVHEQPATTDPGLGLGDVVVDGNRMFAAGGLDGSAFVLALDYGRATGFTEVFAETIGSDSDSDEAFDITVDDGGALWIAGTTALGRSPTAAIVRGNAGGGFCDFPGATVSQSFGRAITSDGGSIYLFAGVGGTIVASRYDADDCTCGSCMVSDTGAPIDVDGMSASVNDATVVGGDVVFAGWTGQDFEEFRPLVGSVDAQGELIAAVVRDPTGAGDGFQQLGTDGVDIYVGGATGFVSLQTLDEGSAVIEVYAAPLVEDAVPLHSFATAQISSVLGLTVEPAGQDGFFVAGAKDGDAFVARCDKLTGCD